MRTRFSCNDTRRDGDPPGIFNKILRWGKFSMATLTLEIYLMKKSTLAIAALFSGIITLSNAASAASILFDEASNLPLDAQASGEFNNFKVSSSGFSTAVGTVVSNETAGNTLLNLGSMTFVGTYSDAAGAAKLGGLLSSKAFSFNIYDDAAFTQLSDTLAVTLTRGFGNNIAVTAAFLSQSLTGYLPTLLAGGANIYETGFVQTALNDYGLNVQFRSDVPVPAALFFVAPALAGAFGFSRRKPAKVELA